MNEERQGNIANTMLAEVPVRMQRSRRHKNHSPNGLPVVYVGRPTKWGNEFIEGKEHPFFGLVKTRIEAVGRYRMKLEYDIKSGIVDLSELKDKNLMCWCGDLQICHADVLLELANR